MTAPIVARIPGNWDNGEAVVEMMAYAVGVRTPGGMQLVSLTDEDGTPIPDAGEIGWTEQEVLGALEVEEERLEQAMEALRREQRSHALPYVPPEVAP